MFSFSQKTKTVAMSIASVGLLTASCGIIDTEQVTGIIEKQQEVERIRRERIQPLIDEIDGINREKIDPWKNKSVILKGSEMIFSEKWNRLRVRRGRKWRRSTRN